MKTKNRKVTPKTTRAATVRAIVRNLRAASKLYRRAIASSFHGKY